LTTIFMIIRKSMKTS